MSSVTDSLKLFGSHCKGDICPIFDDCVLGQRDYQLSVNLIRQEFNFKVVNNDG